MKPYIFLVLGNFFFVSIYQSTRKPLYGGVIWQHKKLPISALIFGKNLSILQG
jgi:hypothetical protein